MREAIVFGVYTNSQGNYFLDEIKQMIIVGLGDSQRVVNCSELSGFSVHIDWHIIVAPHEFFAIGSGLELAKLPLPDQTIFVTTEQIGSPWFEKAKILMDQATYVWEIDSKTQIELQKIHANVLHLPLRSIENFPLFEPVDILPDQNRYFFDDSVRNSPSFLKRPFFERPIDVFFIGAHTKRRSELLSRMADDLQNLNHYFLIVDTSKPLRSEENTALNSSLICGLEQRSKIVINLHRANSQYFESHRMLMHGIAQGALVVSEPFASRPDVDDTMIIQRTMEEMAEHIAYLLISEQGRLEAENVLQEQRASFLKKEDFRQILKKVTDPILNGKV